MDLLTIEILTITLYQQLKIGLGFDGLIMVIIGEVELLFLKVIA